MSNQVGGTGLPKDIEARQAVSDAELAAKADSSGASTLSDEQVKELALQKAGLSGGLTKNINSTYTGPTEVVDLPSKGLVYPKDNPLSSGQVRMKYMSAREEDILTSETLIREGTVIDKLIESMILDPINLDDLIVGDKNWLMIAARILGYGAEFKFRVNDPFSSAEQEVEVNLTELPFKEIDESRFNNENRFTFELPVSKKTIEYKLVTTGSEKELDRQLKKAKFKKDGIDHSLSLKTRNMILSIDGEKDPIAIDREFDNIVARDWKAFRNHLKETQPDVDLKYTFVSEATGRTREMSVPFGPEFFWGD